MVKKPKLDQHHNSRCGASFTCLDCSRTFQQPHEWKGHTSCVSEAQKYERSVWQGDKKKKGGQQQTKQSGSQINNTVATSSAQSPSVQDDVKESSAGKRKRDNEAPEPPSNGKDGPRKSASEAKKLTVESDARCMRSRVLAVIKSKAGKGALSLEEILETMATAEGTKEKKVRKELLKSLKVTSEGEVSWS